ncbi:hypothetical protein G3567_12945 [Psychroflexus sp. YR1-1]|uniref:Lipoprotein n=1 Tax=Psychroflexus aurantiacus TaxID=2709310 RepID=A0A6B3RBY2_9FLAO|nr:hypothetical protein [Psychroflexus aurantiacus]NEV95044.1 hypothetical protein [Psychroflexus aurantiacus]
MKNTLYYILIFYSILSCISKQDKTWEELNKSNDHTKFIPYLLNNTNSSNFEKALDKYYFYKNEYIKNNMPPPIDCFSSCVTIEINRNGEIFFRDENVQIDTLKGRLMEFINNEKKLPDLPSKDIITDNQNIERKISRAIFEITYHESQIEKLKSILQVINNSLNEYSRYLSNSWFNKEFENLNSKNQKLIDSITKSKVRIRKAKDFELKVPPPPEINLDSF